jgi:uncharacterized membrane protein YdjX (TVP38/TMEM64 family)
MPRPARRRVIGVAIAWLALAAVAWAWLGRHEGGVGAGASALLRSLESGPAASFALLAAYLVRPLTLLPVTVLTVYAGYRFGPMGGFVVASLALVVTSFLPYGVAWWARGRRAVATSRLGEGLARHPFEAVLAARLAMLPGDLVSAAAGMLHVRALPFAAATLVGGAPGVLAAVLAGASMQGAFGAEGIVLDPWLIAGAATTVLGSLAIARAARRRRRVA